jgi:hypothetical protein
MSKQPVTVPCQVSATPEVALDGWKEGPFRLWLWRAVSPICKLTRRSTRLVRALEGESERPMQAAIDNKRAALLNPLVTVLTMQWNLVCRLGPSIPPILGWRSADKTLVLWSRNVSTSRLVLHAHLLF